MKLSLFLWALNSVVLCIFVKSLLSKLYRSHVCMLSTLKMYSCGLMPLLTILMWLTLKYSMSFHFIITQVLSFAWLLLTALVGLCLIIIYFFLQAVSHKGGRGFLLGILLLYIFVRVAYLHGFYSFFCVLQYIITGYIYTVYYIWIIPSQISPQVVRLTLYKMYAFCL